MRYEMHLPVTVVTLLFAAFLQSATTTSTWLLVKLPFLTAVALYSALNRPTWPVLVTTLWAGALTDALGGLPALCTPTFLLIAFGVVRIMQRFFLETGVVPGTLLTGAVSLLQTLWTIGATKGGLTVLMPESLKIAILALPAGMAAGLIAFLLCGLIDRVSGIVKPAKGGHGIVWSKNSE